MRKKLLVVAAAAVVLLIIALIAFYGSTTPRIWGEVVQLTHSEDMASWPALVEHGGAMYLFYADRSIAGPVRLTYIRGGFYEWSDPVYLTNESYLPADIKAVVLGEEIHVFWEDGRTPVPIIYTIHGDGKTWSEPIRLAEGRYPYPIVYNDLLYVAYSGSTGHGINIAVYNGTAWRFTSLSEIGRTPRLVGLDGNIYLAWTEGGRIRCSCLGEDMTLKEIVDIADLDRDFLRFPVVASGSGFYIGWSEHVGDDNYEVFVEYVSVSTGTPAPTKALKVSEGDGLSTSPTLAWWDGKLFVAWADKRYGHYEVMLRVLDGSGWSAEYRVTESACDSESPTLVALPAGLYLLWEEHEKPFNVWGVEIRPD